MLLLSYLSSDIENSLLISYFFSELSTYSSCKSPIIRLKIVPEVLVPSMATAAHSEVSGADFPPAPQEFAGNSVLAHLAYVPPEPHTAREVGIPDYMVHDLFLRHMLQRSTTSITDLSKAMRLPDTVVTAVFRQCKHHRLLEVLGMEGNDFQFTLTSAGRLLAGDRASRCSYAGPAPVPLEAYHRSNSGSGRQIDRGPRTP